MEELFANEFSHKHLVFYMYGKLITQFFLISVQCSRFNDFGSKLFGCISIWTMECQGILFCFWKTKFNIILFSKQWLKSLSQIRLKLIGYSFITLSMLDISTYINTKMSVCLYTFFSAISKPIGIPFSGTKLLFAPVKVLKQNYFW